MAFFHIGSVKNLYCSAQMYLKTFCNLLQALSSEDRKQILLDIADALEANGKIIKAENELDVAAAQEAGFEESLVARLVMTPGKVRQYYLLLCLGKRYCANFTSPYDSFVSNVSLFMLDRSRALQLQFVSWLKWKIQ